MTANLQCQSYTINGIKVQFPCKAYPSQLSMMDKIIKGIDRQQNCLLESPTGSGKSLALLCSALAWQAHEREKIAKEDTDKKDCCCCSKPNNKLAQDIQSSYFTPTTQQPLTSQQTPSRTVTLNSVPDIEDDDFKVETKKFCVRQTAQIHTNGENTSQLLKQMSYDETSCVCQGDKLPPSHSRKRVPKIYFSTRTHKQIAQVARELGRTAYRHSRMTILASREHTCVDSEISRLPNKNEECKNKIDGCGCRYFDGVRKVTHRFLGDRGLKAAWDLEEFVGLCQRQKACPYFGARQLKEEADIVFCPYNYLIDPLIRLSMEINLKGVIVILDEAHNIEDSSREAASFSVTQSMLKDAMSDLQILVDATVKEVEHRTLYNMLESFSQFITCNEDSLEGEYNQASRVWSGLDIVATLQHTGVGPENMYRLKQCFQIVTEDEAEKREAENGIKLKASTLQCLSGLFMVLDYIYRDNMKYLDDYKIAIVRSMEYGHVAQSPQDSVGSSRRRRGPKQLSLCYTLHFWCLNPAVAFSDITSDVRCVVLTSGTLSPMETFQSELGAPFPIQLEANHVIGNGQVWVGTISKGPRGTSLLGSYQNSETYAYQDDVGDVVLRVCQTIPHGVLCFLPSYKSMEKLTTRWKNTGLWQRLMQCKSVIVEPRASDKVDFDILIKRYYDLISDHQATDSGHVTGALFIAVCRGKVSEGLDFADNNARAVITVGIPFPNIKATEIELKKQYNDRHSGTRGLLRGRDWYEIQAYRAINQALGRCIRHRNDWGALILVDERYGKNPQRYIKGLSKWIRNRVQYYSTFQQAENSLKTFTKERLKSTATANSSLVSSDSPGSSSVLCETIEMSTASSQNDGRASTNQSFTAATITSYFKSANHEQEACRPDVAPTNQRAAGSTSGVALANQRPLATPPDAAASERTAIDDSVRRRYMNPSEAGGFIPSQLGTGPTQDAVRAELDTPTAAEPELDFNPAVTSTQAHFERSLSETTRRQDDLSPAALEPDPDDLDGTADREPVAPAAHPDGARRPASWSPTLFDSDDESQRLGQGRSTSTAPTDPSQVRKPIFKRRTSTPKAPADGMRRKRLSLDRSEPRSEPLGERPSAASPAKGQRSAGQPTVSERNSRSAEDRPKESDDVEMDPERRDDGESKDPVVRSEPASNPVLDTRGLEVETGRNDDDRTKNNVTESITLNTKRAKRRHGNHGNVRITKRRGIQFDDDDEEGHVTEVLTKKSKLTLSCPGCGTKLSTFTDYRRESYVPDFVKVLFAFRQYHVADQLVSVNKDHLADGLLSTVTSQDTPLNSYYSVKDGCSVELLTCSKCADVSNSATERVPYLGARVLLVGQNNPRLKLGQVWFPPQYLDT